jgi:drug/metabolite transporter (DMT)-like permease
MPVRSAALLVALAALWGGSFVFMRVAVPALGPFMLAFVRVALAAAALLAVGCAQRRLPDLRTHWRAFVLVGIVNSALPFVLFSYAEQYLSASAGAILNATSPFFVAITAAIWLGEAMTPVKIAGLAIGFSGVAVLVGWHPGTMTRDVALATAACLAATVCYALSGTFIKRRLANVPTFGIAAASQLMAALVLAPAAAMAPAPGPVTPLVVANVAALALASTAVAYLIYFKLIADIGPTRTMTVTFLIPLFGVLWGNVFLDEALTLDMLAGGALIVAGTALAVRR